MKKFCKEYLPYIIVIIIVVLLRTYIITIVRVSGDSMYDTLKNGDIMFLYKLDDIEKEDIVVISKDITGSRIIKRVIGMPGDTVRCENGIIYINNKKYDDKYATNDTSDFKAVTLKDDEYFVLGDNRAVSYDSRYFGVVDKEDILGTAKLRVFPFNKIGNVK